MSSDGEEDYRSLLEGDCSDIDGLLKNDTTVYGSDADDLIDSDGNDNQYHVARSQKITWYVIGASFMAALGGILFGYDIGIISGALLQLTTEYSLNCFQREMVVSGLLIGAVIGSAFGGFVLDYFGRRRTIIVNAVVFVIGAIILVFSQSFPVLILGRLILGIGVAISAIGECIYISEIAPINRRGLLVTFNEVGITAGLLIAYLVNYAFITKDNGWRYMFGLSIIPSLIQGIGMNFLPPSPRFLLLQNKEKEAEIVLQKMRGESNVSSEMNDIKHAIALKKKKVPTATLR